MATPQLLDLVGTHVPVFRQMQIKDHVKHLGVVIGPGAANHRWTRASVGVGARICASSQSLVQRLVPFKIYASSVLSFVGSVAEPDTATTVAENRALQRLSAGPFHASLSALLRRRSACGLKIDVDGIQLTSKAVVFELPLGLWCCQQAWNASALRRIILAEPLIPLPGAGMTSIFVLRLPTSQPLPFNWLAEWTVFEA